MRVLDELEREISRVAVEAGDVRRRRSGARMAVLPLSLAVVAVAASAFVLLGGSPKHASPPPAVAPQQGVYGSPRGAAKVLDVRADDPAGGPPWALRLTRTTRGFGCVELGRLQDGKLGVLGADGTFHERAPRLSAPANCQVPDAAGNLFIAMTYVGLPAGGDMRSCNPQRAVNGVPKCPADSLRTVYYGLLGPDATAVTYRDGSRIVRQAVSRPEGAYLVVKQTEQGRGNVGYFSPGVSPGSGLRSVEYADGSRCVIPNPRRLGGARSCPLRGYVAPKLPHVDASDLASTVRVVVGSKPEKPPGVQAPTKIPAQRRVTIRFRARVGADVRSFYTVRYQVKNGNAGCSTGIVGGPIIKDVAAGAVVRHDVWVSYGCRGTMEISVGFEQQRKPATMPFMVSGLGDARVGRAEVAVG
ncbi:hypothetical protein [Solirubrobacter soli]|uniref:hypothetical protein n=1 Tax=Solirubrobacter soli TaxID=363832 RepID=UPI000400F88A|nr:hypothetical protein [Solirubrobacter soli]